MSELRGQDDLQGEIVRLQRRLERERQARLEAEAIAERGLRELYDRHQAVRLLHDVAVSVNAAPSVVAALRTTLSETCRQAGWHTGHAYLVHPEGKKLVSGRVGHASDPVLFNDFLTVSQEMEFSLGAGLPGRVWERKAPEWIEDIEQDFGFFRRDVALGLGLRCGFAVPVLIDGETFAVLEFFTSDPRPQDDHFLDIVAQLALTLGRMVERLRGEEKDKRHVARLHSLHAIDLAITSSLDLQLTLGVFLDQVLSLLNVQAAEVLLYNPHTHGLHPAIGKGFRTPRSTATEIRLGQGHAGAAALRRRIVHVADLGGASVPGVPDDEAFAGYLAAPLVSKGHVKGVLQVFRRGPMPCDADLLEFVEALARQAAIAVDNSTLFESLQRSNIELSLAYDATIEGWSRALDLRDKETEGHTRRVTDLTMRLARTMDLPEADLVHVRRGALLHDIGKMGIPDRILHKEGPLDDEEWAIMRTHPSLAFEMLRAVDFLRPALDIPHAHHEKWDGTGYPRGLTAEQIPLAARIFAVVDVWDALRSDRPYKKGWSFDKALDHIAAQGGRHFDPVVVERFVAMMRAEGSTRSWAGLGLAA